MAQQRERLMGKSEIKVEEDMITNRGDGEINKARNEETIVAVMQRMDQRIDKLEKGTKPKKGVKIKLPQFDNSESLLTFLAQFEICARRNNWTTMEKRDLLKCSLRGSSAQILWDTDVDGEISYEEMVDLLKQRFGTSGQAEVYRAQVRNKKQGQEETLNMLMLEIKKLMSLAYPKPTSEVGQIIARDAFIDALKDRQLAIKVFEREPSKLEAAYQIAVKIEKSKEVESRRVNAEEIAVEEIKGNEERRALKEMISEMQQQLNAQNEVIKELKGDEERENNWEKRRKEDREEKEQEIVCHKCKQSGHIKLHCKEWKNKRKKEIEEEGEKEERKRVKKNSRIKFNEAWYIDLQVGETTRQCLVDQR